MLNEILGVYGKVGQSGRNDDDVYDRYSHRWTVILLGFFAIALSAKQFVGDPIECIPPPDFGGTHKTYVDNYCWIHSTYSIDENAALTRNFVRGGQGSRTTPYYIWVPYILTLAALCTYLPAWIWHIVGHRATFDIPAMIHQVAKTNLTDPEERRTTLIVLSKHYEKAQRYSKLKLGQTDNIFKRVLSACMFFAGGGVLTGIYFLIKMLYLLNAIGQFFLINYYLQIDYLSYGQKVLYGIMNGRDWLENKFIFPRVVFCDFTIRYLGDNNLNYTIQCALPVNLYNERIFAFYWFWLIFLSVATFYGIIVWVGNMSYRGRRGFLKRHLRLSLQSELTDVEKNSFDGFVDRHLGGDGILFLRLIAKNTNPVIAGELLGIMWNRYITPPAHIAVVSTNQNAQLTADTYLNGGALAKANPLAIKDE
ncbi:unnamed protein product [Adineta ricciae]|uniref:Innexin n=1 Tax=Adineta ricciae TaxID=249248 RepID=A0A814WZY6_ADIRI|nr:unnamed protein product [Adineta ricciae]